MSDTPNARLPFDHLRQTRHHACSSLVHGQASPTRVAETAEIAPVALPIEAFGLIAGDLNAINGGLVSLKSGLGDAARELVTLGRTAQELAAWACQDPARIWISAAVKPEIEMIAVAGVAIQGRLAVIHVTTAAVAALACEIREGHHVLRAAAEGAVVVSLDRYRSAAQPNRRGDERAAEILGKLGVLLNGVADQRLLQGKLTDRLAEIRGRLTLLERLAEPPAARNAPNGAGSIRRLPTEETPT